MFRVFSNSSSAPASRRRLPAVLLAAGLAAATFAGAAAASASENHGPANAEEAKVCSDLLGWAQGIVGLPATSVDASCTVRQG
ncbi:hypothetical protein [Kitasatospora sp. NPDC004289]